MRDDDVDAFVAQHAPHFENHVAGTLFAIFAAQDCVEGALVDDDMERVGREVQVAGVHDED